MSSLLRPWLNALLHHPARTLTLALLLAAAGVAACDTPSEGVRHPLSPAPLACPPPPVCPDLEPASPCPASDDATPAVHDEPADRAASSRAAAASKDRPPGRRPAPASPPLPDDQRIDLNLASPQELERLPGVGPKMAERIVTYRERRPFTDPRQLMRVKGIGQRSWKRIAPMVKVGPAPAP